MKHLFIFVFLLLYLPISSQTTVCEGSPCTSNDFTIDSFFLGDEFGNPTAAGACDFGDVVEEHLWLNFTANTNASRYSLFIHYNLYIDGEFSETVDVCLYEGQSVPLNQPLDTHTFNWVCGSDVSLEGLYMSWQTNSSQPCECSRSKCYQEDIIIVGTPLIANYFFTADCLIDYHAQFTSTTAGGTGPYTYFWNFGDGTTSTLENPSHTFSGPGPFIVSLVVTDTSLNIVSTIEQLVVFEADDIPLVITPPSNIIIEGCDITSLSPFVYSDVPVSITEADIIAMGGSVEYYADGLTMTYVDSLSGTCPITVTRTFSATDSCNNMATAVQELIINDTIPPTASPLDPIIIPCDGDPIPPVDISVITDAADNCSAVTITNEVGDVSDNQQSPETITRTYTLRDECNNETIIIQEIIIEEVCPDPLIINYSFETNCITDFYAEFTSTVTGGVGPYTYFWNFGDGTTSTLANPTHTFPGTGPYNITLTVTDSALNISSLIEQIVTFEANNIPLIITPPSNATIEGCDTTSLSPFVYSTTPVTITEADITAMGGSIEYYTDTLTMSYVDSSSGTCPITITRTFTATDSCNTTVNATQEFIIEDTTPPVASPLAPILIVCEGDPIPPADISLITDASDNCSTVTITNEVADVSDNQQSPETITRTYTLRDACNNETIVTQDIIIQYVCTEPIVNFNYTTNCLIDYYAEFNSTVIGGIGPYTYLWDFGDGMTSTLENPIYTFSGPGPFNVTLTVTDNTSNVESTIVQVLTFEADNTILIITPPLNTTIEGCDTVAISPFVFSTTPVSITEADLILMGGSVEYYTDTLTMSYVDSSSGTCPLTVTRTFAATDTCNTTTSATQEIIIEDTTPPTASPLASIAIPCEGDPIPPADISIITDATDNCLGAITITNEIADVSDNQQFPETITRTYTLRDTCNNETIITQEIIIEQACPDPLIVNYNFETNCTTDFYAEFTSTVTGGIGPYTYFWDFGDGTTSTLENPTHTFPGTGPYNIALTVIDSALNINSYVEQLITFEANNIPLVITPPSNITIVGCDITSLSPIIYSETSVNITEADLINLGGSVEYYTDILTMSYIDSSSGTCPITITRTFAATDSCNTTTTATQEFVIDDTMPPTASSLAPIIISCDGDPIPLADINLITDVLDDCSVTVTNEVPDVSDNQQSPETITRTYTLRDACNNETLITQDIIIEQVCPDPLVVSYNYATNCIIDFYAEYSSVVMGGVGPYTYFWNLGDGTTSTLENPTHTYSNEGPFNVTLTVIDNVLNISSSVSLLITFEANDIPLNILPSNETVIEGCDLSSLQPFAYSEVPVSITPDDMLDMGGFIEHYTPLTRFNYVDATISSEECSTIITRTFSAEDSCGTIAIESYDILIEDRTPPEGNPLDPIQIRCRGNIPPPDINLLLNVTDNCSAVTVTNEVADVSDNQVSPETITRTYTLRDACGNETIIIQNIIVESDCVEPNNCDVKDLSFLTISEIVTPNGDQKHDFFEIKTPATNLEFAPCNLTLEVEIFNRWGTRVFKSDNYDNTWNGVSNNSDFLPSGTYFYMIKTKNTNGEPIQGFFFLGSE